LNQAKVRLVETLVCSMTLSDTWDTLIFNDRKVKHEVRPFVGSAGAYRDVIVNDLKKPYSNGLDTMMDDNMDIVSMI